MEVRYVVRTLRGMFIELGINGHAKTWDIKKAWLFEDVRQAYTVQQKYAGKKGYVIPVTEGKGKLHVSFDYICPSCKEPLSIYRQTALKSPVLCKCNTCDYKRTVDIVRLEEPIAELRGVKPNSTKKGDEQPETQQDWIKDIAIKTVQELETDSMTVFPQAPLGSKPNDYGYPESIKSDVIKSLIRQCYGNAKKKGFWGNGTASEEDINKRNVVSKIMLIVTELAEATEALRKQEVNKEEITEEFCDAVIRIFDLCGFMQLDFAQGLFKKMKVNESRPYLHNKRF